MVKQLASFFSRPAEILAWVGRPLKKFFSFSLADESIAPGQSLSVQVELSGISVAHGARFLSRLTIKGTRHYPYEAGRYPHPEAVASAVHLAINDLQAIQADVTLIVPKAWVIIKKVDFPLIVKQNLANVLRYELDRLTPLSSEQAYYDYRVIAEDGGRLQILLAAMKAEKLDTYLHALRQKGIQVKRVIVSLSALGVLSQHVNGGETTAFLDVHPDDYEGGLIDNKGCLTASLSGSFSSAGEPEKASTIASAINPLLDALKKEDKSPLLYIDSKTGPSPLLLEQIHAPVRFFGSSDLKLRFSQPEKMIPYITLGGVLESLQMRLKGLNLLDKGIHKTARTPLGLTIFLCIGLAALGLFSLAASRQVEAKKVEVLESEIEARTKEVRQIETLQKDTAALAKEIQAIDQFKTARPMAMDLIKEITRLLPKYAWLARVHITDTSVNIEGYAATSPTNLLPLLEASRYFNKVEFASPTFRDARLSADRFAIKMEIEGLAEENNAKK